MRSLRIGLRPATSRQTIDESSGFVPEGLDGPFVAPVTVLARSNDVDAVARGRRK
jgi:hypothetical protein